MRTIGRITLALIITIIIRRTWKPAAKWVFTRIPVETHPDCKPRYRTWKNGIEIVNPVPPYATSIVESMAHAWHDVSDHAADGTPYGAPLCNCGRIAHRAYNLRWYPVPTP